MNLWFVLCANNNFGLIFHLFAIFLLLGGKNMSVKNNSILHRKWTKHNNFLFSSSGEFFMLYKMLDVTKNFLIERTERVSGMCPILKGKCCSYTAGNRGQSENNKEKTRYFHEMFEFASMASNRKRYIFVFSVDEWCTRWCAHCCIISCGLMCVCVFVCVTVRWYALACISEMRTCVIHNIMCKSNSSSSKAASSSRKKLNVWAVVYGDWSERERIMDNASVNVNVSMCMNDKWCVCVRWVCVCAESA